MPGDLFAQSVTSRPGPTRSKWTIAGSILAHAGLVAVLLVVPVLSALDDFVAVADGLKYVHIPPAMPAMPAAPPGVSRASAAQPLNKDAAPPDAATRLPTQEPPEYRTSLGDLFAPPGSLPGGGGTSIMPGVGSGPPAPPSPPAAGPPETADVPRRPGGDIKIPARTYYVEPVYPTIARAAGLEAMIILEATIDESGVVRNVKVLRSHAMFDQAAVDAVSKWKYTPTRLNGVAIPIVLTVTVNFALR